MKEAKGPTLEQDGCPSDAAGLKIYLRPKGRYEDFIDSNGSRARRFRYEDFSTEFSPRPSHVAFSEIALIIRDDEHVYLSLRIDSQADPEQNGPNNDITFHTRNGDIQKKCFAKMRWEGNTHFTRTYPVAGPSKVAGAFASDVHPTWMFWW